MTPNQNPASPEISLASLREDATFDDDTVPETDVAQIENFEVLEIPDFAAEEEKEKGLLDTVKAKFEAFDQKNEAQVRAGVAFIKDRGEEIFVKTVAFGLKTVKLGIPTAIAGKVAVETVQAATPYVKGFSEAVTETAPQAAEAVSNLAPQATQAAEAVSNLAPQAAQAVEGVANVVPQAAQAVEGVSNLAPQASEAVSNLAPQATQAAEAVANLAPQAAQSVEGVANVVPNGVQAAESVGYSAGQTAKQVWEGGKALVAEYGDEVLQGAEYIAKGALIVEGAVAIVNTTAEGLNSLKRGSERAWGITKDFATSVGVTALSELSASAVQEVTAAALRSPKLHNAVNKFVEGPAIAVARAIDTSFRVLEGNAISKQASAERTAGHLEDRTTIFSNAGLENNSPLQQLAERFSTVSQSNEGTARGTTMGLLATGLRSLERNLGNNAERIAEKRAEAGQHLARAERHRDRAEGTQGLLRTMTDLVSTNPKFTNENYEETHLATRLQEWAATLQNNASDHRDVLAATYQQHTSRQGTTREHGSEALQGLRNFAVTASRRVVENSPLVRPAAQAIGRVGGALGRTRLGSRLVAMTRSAASTVQTAVSDANSLNF
jgi:uncharacterized phage infection (PIP) family protein YhgE